MSISHVKSNTFADFTGTFTGFNSQGSTTTIAATDIVRPSDWNSGHNLFYTLSGNTTNASTASGTNVVYSAAGAMTLGGSTGTIVFSAPLAVTMQAFEAPVRGGSTTSQTLANGTWYFQPVQVDANVSAYQMGLLQVMSTQGGTTYSVSASISAGAASSGTWSMGYSGTVALFSRQSTGTAPQTSNLISIQSATTSYSIGISQSVSWSTNASSASASFSSSIAFGYLANFDSAGGTTTSSQTSSGSSTFSSTSTNANSFGSSFTNTFASGLMSGIRPNYIPFPINMAMGEYWVGFRQSTTTGTTNDTRLSRIVSMGPPGMLAYVTNTQGYAELGNTVSIATANLTRGWGSGNMDSVTSTTFGMNSISNMSNFQTYVMFAGRTF